MGLWWNPRLGLWRDALSLFFGAVLPITTGQARAASVPKVQIQGLSSTALVRAAGNAMNLPCIGVAMLGIICGLEEL